MTDATTRAAELLKEHRESIDRLDAILVYTLGERFKHTQAVGRLKAEHDKAVDSVLNRVEASLKRQKISTPGQYRTEAIKLADELVDSGKRKKPSNILEGIDLMEECYLQAISAHTKKKVVSVDVGKAGVTSGTKKTDEIKPGSLSEVKAQMLKNKSWKED